ncbi:hypothetical protein OS493_019953 [Desmophyllum pertusum]|uniref:Uncharacterized protein n=1 Tax=Desmophyllum pertusum TaxID=174260 RepID=A0A9W9YN36_9CNID|nr:hypothetical protein OS493_019953 [Desmophyllum pertusum]
MEVGTRQGVCNNSPAEATSPENEWHSSVAPILCRRASAKPRGRSGRDVAFGVRLGETASGADLGGSSSKYSNENFEDRSGKRFHVNSSWTWSTECQSEEIQPSAGDGREETEDRLLQLQVVAKGCSGCSAQEPTPIEGHTGNVERLSRDVGTNQMADVVCVVVDRLVLVGCNKIRIVSDDGDIDEEVITIRVVEKEIWLAESSPSWYRRLLETSPAGLGGGGRNNLRNLVHIIHFCVVENRQ